MRAGADSRHDPSACAAASAPSGGVALVEVNLRVTLVGGDHKTVSIRKFEQQAPLVLSRYPASWIVRRTHIQQLRPIPDIFRHIRPERRAAIRVAAVDEMRGCARKQRGALVDLIERIGSYHGCPNAARIDQRLRDREQGFARAEYRAAPALRRRSSAARIVAAARRRWLRAARARRPLWDNATVPRPPAARASSSSAGVGCLGSPIERLIGRRCGFGATFARRCRSRSNGYGCSNARCGFNGC